MFGVVGADCRASGADAGESFGSTGPTAARKPAMAGAGGTRRDDMDDEIPF